jgi:hypothetical protein
MDRFRLKCSLCGKPKGACIQCPIGPKPPKHDLPIVRARMQGKASLAANPNPRDALAEASLWDGRCLTAVHVSCAHAGGLATGFVPRVVEPKGGRVAWTSYCFDAVDNV